MGEWVRMGEWVNGMILFILYIWYDDASECDNIRKISE